MSTIFENEIGYYRKHFIDKIIYMPCDNPEWSNFWRVLKEQYTYLHYKKIIATFYKTPCKTVEENCQMLCKSCNASKGARMI